MIDRIFEIAPPAVKIILRRLKDAGKRAYIVGGAARDCVMGAIPDDWDVATSATPSETRSLFAEYEAIETGIKHGTVAILIGGKPFEITTFRKEGAYRDFRRPETVEFVSDLKEDLARRDFTVNALAYGDDEGIIDLYGGLSDIDNRLIRAVGNPFERFEEDALRILRAARFSAKLGFSVEENTRLAAIALRKNLNAISAERVYCELVKTILAKNAVGAALDFREVFEEILSVEEDKREEISNADKHIVEKYAKNYETSVRAVGLSEKRADMRLAALCMTVGSTSRTQKVAQKLKFPGKIAEKVLFLADNFNMDILPDIKEIKRALFTFGEEDFTDLLSFKIAFAKAENSLCVDELVRAQNICEEVKKSGECFSVKGLKIGGEDLVRFGYRGSAIKRELSALVLKCVDDPSLNERDKLLSLAKEDMKG